MASALKSTVDMQVYPPVMDRRGELKKGDPIGYLKINPATNGVALYLLPYNYPVLLGLVDQLLRMPPAAKLSPPRAWLVVRLAPLWPTTRWNS